MTSQGRELICVGLLDDHPLLRETVALGLRAQGFDVISSTSNPTLFIDELKDRARAVAIVDLRIEEGSDQPAGYDGVHVLMQLRSASPAVRTMVLSGDAGAETIARCRTAGASAFLSKTTAELPEIASTVRRVASGERDLGLDPRAVARRSRAGTGVLGQLTPRELEVLSFISVGADNLKIAVVLGITERTVRAHMHSLYRKLGSENRTKLAVLAQRCGVQPPAGY